MPFLKNPKLISRETEDGLLLFNAESGRMMELNSTARLLWEGTGDEFGFGDLMKVIAERCEGAEGAEEDMREFVEAAKRMELVSGDG